MSQAKIYWEMSNYAQVEKIFRKSVEFCSEHDVWKLNVAHTLFMQVTYLIFAFILVKLTNYFLNLSMTISGNS